MEYPPGAEIDVILPSLRVTICNNSLSTHGAILLPFLLDLARAVAVRAI
jgi:hypothetical protein